MAIISKSLFLSAALLCALFFILVFFMRQGYIVHFDHSVLIWFDSVKTSSLDIFFRSITWLGSLWVLGPLSIALFITLIIAQQISIAWVFGIGFWGATLSTYVFKYLFSRSRPEFFEALQDMPNDPAFPSAHTTQAFSFALMSIIVLWYLKIPSKETIAITLGISAILVAISRMYLQVHYPSDVLAGIIIASLGFVLAWISLYSSTQ